MPEVTSHALGAPSWFELSTNDETGALEFYSAIFSWVDDPQPIGENWLYHMQKLNGLEAAAIFQQPQEERRQGVPSHWNTYFTVTNVDESVSKVQQAGGPCCSAPWTSSPPDAWPCFKTVRARHSRCGNPKTASVAG